MRIQHSYLRRSLIRSLTRPLALCSLCALLTATLAAAPLRPTHAPHAIVTSVHELASRAGIEMLRSGGNAVDAAVATGFALAVVYPRAGNLGGGGFLLLRNAGGKTRFIDFREKAPAAATENMYLDAHGNVIPDSSKDSSVVGYKSIGVPGSVAGLVYAEKQYGKLSLGKVIAPAIKLARDGFPLAYEDAQALQEDKYLAQFPESKRIFQRDGNYYQPGERFKQPDLAHTLERIAKNPDEFYHGAMARELAAAIYKGGGLVTSADLAAYEVKEREPIRGSYRGYDIISAPPPSAGGVALVEILNILEGFDLAKFGNRSADAIHLEAEAFRRAFYDRTEFMGDPDFAKVPVAQLIDKKYAAAWRDSIDPNHASVSRDLKRPPIFNELERVAQARRTAIREPENTTHYSVVDAEGNAVSVTTTLNDSFGSRVTAAGLGFLLNDEMDDFAAKQGVPNNYGLIQGPANAIGPGKRPLSAMTPTIVLKDGKLFLVLGSPGGPTITTTVANVLIGVVDFSLDIQEAVNAPRFHHQWLPDEILVEDRLSPDTMNLLHSKGHKLNVRHFWGDGECIMVDPKTGERLGASDGRNNGKAVGY
jgi:gamma-glutamyltranspeptidase/glutathione hydrolase